MYRLPKRPLARNRQRCVGRKSSSSELGLDLQKESKRGKKSIVSHRLDTCLLSLRPFLHVPACRVFGQAI